MPRITQSRHRRVVAAYKGQITRLKKRLAKQRPAARRKAKRFPILVEREQLTLYEATATESANGFGEWASYPVRATAWAVHVQALIDNAVMAEDTLTVLATWDEEKAPSAVMRSLRDWLASVKADHPEWGDDSPRVTVTLLQLQRAV